MAITHRQAEQSDLGALLDLIAVGFSAQSSAGVDLKEGEEHRVLFSYLYAQKSWDPAWVYVAESENQLLAAVGFFPQTLMFSGTPLSIWAVSPVVTHLEHRREGFAGKCLIYGLADLKSKKIAAVFLWGLPKFYPRFGFVPLLPRYKTKLTWKTLKQEKSSTGHLRRAKYEDLQQISDIYDSSGANLWLQPQRVLAWWQGRWAEMDVVDAVLKEVPFPKKENLMVWENISGTIKGYLYYHVEPDKQRITILEAASSDPESAIELLGSFWQQFLKENQTLLIRGTPDHFLNLAAYRLGGIHLNPAPGFGMLKVIDWNLFLTQLTPILNTRLKSVTMGCAQQHFDIPLPDLTLHIEINANQVTCLTVSPMDNLNHLELNSILTRIVFGFYDQQDLRGISPEGEQIIKLVFPSEYPFIWDANYLY